MSAAKSGKGSMFSSLGSRGAEHAPPAPEAASPGALQPLQERIDALEARLAEAGKNDPNDRIALLEKQLKETQEKAIASALTLREREEAQKAAQRESEAMLKTLAAQRRAEELDRQLREQLASQRKRIDDLEHRLLETATSAGGARQLEAVVAAQRMADGRLEGFEAELRTLSDKLDELKRTGDASAAGLATLRMGLDLLKGQADARFAAGDAAAAASAAALAALESGVARAAAELESQAAREREVSASAVAALRIALDRLHNPAPAAGPAEAEAPGSALSRSLEFVESSLKSAEEARVTAMKAELRGFREEFSALAKAVQSSAAENAAVESRLRSELCAEAADRKAALESLGAGLSERLDAREGRWEQRLSALRAEFQAHAARSESGAAELREKAAANAQLASALDYALRALKSEAVSVEALRAVQTELSALQTEAGLWAQARAYQGDLTSRIEQVRLDFEDKVKASAGAVAAFETEIRGLILSRLMRLEERVSKKES